MIKLQNVSKKIKDNEVLKNINYEFKEGHIYGLHGTNGSGKTMLMRAIAGLIIIDSGEIIINDKKMFKDIEFPESMGLIIENMQMLPQYTGFENLKLISNINKIATNEDIENALERVGLKDNNKIVKKYSLGMKQRLNIAQAIFEKPQIILLDEPTNAIDETGVQDIYKLLKEEKERGAIIIIASHHKNDFEEICDYSIKMNEGEIVDEKSL